MRKVFKGMYVITALIPDETFPLEIRPDHIHVWCLDDSVEDTRIELEERYGCKATAEEIPIYGWDCPRPRCTATARP